MPQIIAITVANKTATTDFQEVVSFNSEYTLQFTFDSEWEAFSQRVAVVLWADGCAERVFTGTECLMPTILSHVCDTALLGVYSVNGDKRIASTFIRLRCRTGAHSEHKKAPSKSLQEQILSLINEKDWSIFDKKLRGGVYSAVRVNPIGLVTEGKQIIEVGSDGQTLPSENLVDGGIFFRRENGVCTACYYKNGVLEELTVSGSGSSQSGYPLTIGGKRYDGTAAVTVTANDLGFPVPESIYRGQAIVVNSDGNGYTFGGAPVSSVNGLTGEVTITKYDLELASVAISGSYSDLKDSPIPALNSIYRGQALVVNSDGTGFEFGGAPVSSVNGLTGEVTITKYDLGLASVAISGSYSDLKDSPIPVLNSIYRGQALVVNSDGTGFEFGGAPVSSVNGLTGEVTITKYDLGLASVAISGSYSDLKDSPIPALNSIYKGQALVVNSDGTGFEFGGAPVSSVNGLTGEVTITKYDLGLASVAISGNYTDLKNSPIPALDAAHRGEALIVDSDGTGFEFGGAPVSSVNGQSGEVTITKYDLGLPFPLISSGTPGQVPVINAAGTAYEFVDLSSAGEAGLEGLSIYHTTANTSQASPSNILTSTISVPEGRTIKVGDLIIGNSTYNYLYRVTGVASSFVSVVYLCSLRGATGETGAKGETGAAGAKGETGAKGEDGNGIASVKVMYAHSTSGTVIPTSWLTTIPSVVAGSYFWTRTVTTCTDGTSTTAYSIARQGADGAKGAKGETGAAGATGAKGADGNGVSSAVVTYAASTSGTEIPSDEWSEAIPSVAAGSYLWTRTVTTYTNGTSTTAYSVARQGADGAKGTKGETGATGATGAKGADGNGIASVKVMYAHSTSGTVIPTSWLTTIPSVVAGSYFWTRTVTTYTDGTSTTAYSIARQGADGAKGAKGETGATGATGAKGADGNGVSSAVVTYASSASGTEAPTEWSETIPSVDPGSYFWVRTVTTYTDGTSTTAYSVARHGKPLYKHMLKISAHTCYCTSYVKDPIPSLQIFRAMCLQGAIFGLSYSNDNINSYISNVPIEWCTNYFIIYTFYNGSLVKNQINYTVNFTDSVREV